MDARSAVFAGITALLLQSGLPSNAQTAPPIKDPPCIAEMDLANFINGYNGNHAMLADQARAWTRIGRSLNIPSQLQRGQCINE
ncbi:MAG TPA: hypothetical protein VJB12_03890, partial [Candidatus Nanoarchaeia archaeon]|nr:hypothetical protein [Candidatus Nanoarchaeia archaeon]